MGKREGSGGGEGGRVVIHQCRTARYENQGWHLAAVFYLAAYQTVCVYVCLCWSSSRALRLVFLLPIKKNCLGVFIEAQDGMHAAAAAE